MQQYAINIILKKILILSQNPIIAMTEISQKNSNVTSLILKTKNSDRLMLILGFFSRGNSLLICIHRY